MSCSFIKLKNTNVLQLGSKEDMSSIQQNDEPLKVSENSYVLVMQLQKNQVTAKQFIVCSSNVFGICSHYM